MELTLLDELSLWDSISDPQWIAGGDGSKEFTNGSNVVPADFNPFDAGNEHLLPDGLDPLGDDEFCDWMETKFDFDECNMTLLDDVERLLADDVPLPSEADPLKLIELTTPQELCEQLTTLLPPGMTAVIQDLVLVSETSSEVSAASPPEIVAEEADETWEDRPARRQNGKRRVQPYPKVEKGLDRKSRKRSQNRDAATRYRIKKREEAELLSVEEAGLEKRRGELKSQVENLTREIGYLKGLMRELIVAKKK